MNGEVNGTMEEPMETSLPSSPVNTQNCNKVTTEVCEITEKNLEKCNNPEINNHLVNISNEDEPESVPAESSHQVDTEDGSQKDESDAPASHVASTQENSNNITGNMENNCSNSNESYPESLSNSQAKTEILEQSEIHDEEEKSKLADAENNCSRTVTVNDEESEDEVDSEADSSEEGSELSAEPRAEDTVSINSDSDPDGADETSRESKAKDKNNSDIIILENDNGPDDQNGNSHDSEVHEILSDNDNDDCVMTNEEKSDCDNKVQLRRSSRAIKRKIYLDEEMENGGDDGSDVEEVEMEDPLKKKSKPIVISDTKALVAMAVKQSKLGVGNNNQKKEPTVVIIDTNSIVSGKCSSSMPVKPPVTTMSAENLYQSIVARGTTVTPVSSKTTTVSSVTTQNTTQAAQTSILPSLTDDMFVVEAPSFIVPYVYEKPSVKPFREFVDILGKELEEQKAKEEKERSEKEALEKEKREKERKEKRERGEVVEESEEEKEVDNEKESSKLDESLEEEKKKKKAEKKERRQRKNDDDDASWDGESSEDSDDDINSDEEDKTVVIKDKADSIEEIKDVSELISDKITTGKSDNYFDCSLGKFFINIGLNFVQEYVQNDLLKQQNRKLYREKKSGHSTKATESSIASLMKNLEFSKENNAPYRNPQIKCEFCSFKTESMLVMSHHLETPHMKNNVYKCNFCPFEIRSPHDILYHMEAEHNTRGKLERAPAYHQCANCPFEDNGKGKLARHLIPCAKKFKPEVNLAPPIEWEPPAKIPKITRSRNNMLGPYQGNFGRGQVANSLCRPPMNVASLMGAGGAAGLRARGRAPATAAPRALHPPAMIRGVVVRQSGPVQNNNKNAAMPKSMHQPSISITPLPRQPQPAPAPALHAKSTFVICEICDGYIKDLEQLRNHMQWIHKVKIHPKMIYNRPPLNCQKCQFRFFTDQGLERHLLGSHGLVTSSMQEAANKGKDAGRCPVCGRVYQWKLLNHVARDHNLTLKPAHLSYKCTVCTATFGMYKQFENHVYSAHSVVAKRVMDKSKAPAAAAKPDSLLKPLKINDEITIIPQPVKATTPTPAKDK